jgi:hypothetical protein
MDSKHQKIFQKYQKNVEFAIDRTKSLLEGYEEAIEFIMEKGLYASFLAFQVEKLKKVSEQREANREVESD